MAYINGFSDIGGGLGGLRFLKVKTKGLNSLVCMAHPYKYKMPT